MDNKETAESVNKIAIEGLTHYFNDLCYSHEVIERLKGLYRRYSSLYINTLKDNYGLLDSNEVAQDLDELYYLILAMENKNQ